MKTSRIIWLLIIGAIVYWGAAYPTLGNWIEALLVKLKPVGDAIVESIDNLEVNGFIDKLEALGDAALYRIANMVMLGFSCLALALSILYRFTLIKGAELRNTTEELNDLIRYAALCVLLTFYVFGKFHWWTILAPPIFAYVIAYPLLYIPYYRYFRWIYTLLYTLIVIILDGIYISVYIADATLVWKIVGFIVAIFAFIYYILHRKPSYCPECKRYANFNDNQSYYTTESRSEGKVIKGVVKVMLGKRVVDEIKNAPIQVWNITETRHYHDTYTCSFCGHKWEEHEEFTSHSTSHTAK